MKNIIYRMTKTNILSAVLVACLFAIVSNNVFDFVACQVVSETTAQNANTLIDVLQLVSYVGVKLFKFNRLDRYDLPFVVGGSLAIIL